MAREYLREYTGVFAYSSANARNTFQYFLILTKYSRVLGLSSI
jgi:hypothetical protein